MRNTPTDRSDKGATGKQATLKAVTVKLDSMRSELLHDKLSSGLELAEAELEYVDMHDKPECWQRNVIR
jgi:hypothetical protein